MEEVQVGNSEESPAEETTGVVETEAIQVTLAEQAKIEEVERAPEEDSGGEEAEAESSEEPETASAAEAEAEPETQGIGEGVEAEPAEQSASEEPEAALQEEAETEEGVEVSADLQAGNGDAEPGIKLQVGDVNGEVLSDEEEDQSEMGGIPVEDWDYQRPKRGEVRMGVILSIDEQEIIADVGAKRDGIVPYADMQRMGEEALAELQVGSEVPVYVLRPEDKEGNLLISLYMARQQQAWIDAQELADSGEIWEEEVIGYNKGGLVVPVEEIRGFIPASQVPGFPHGLSQEERLDRLSTMVGEKLPVKVIEINRRKRRLILSSTAAQRDWRKKARKKLLDELREGEVRTGKVSSLCSFGAFVDLGGADGLVHISELSWRRIRHPREVVSVGEEVEVYVLRLDQERQRIGLSLKRLQPEPWSLVEDKYELGQLIEGVVTNVVDFGAFAEVEQGVEGLIHVSELAEAPISHPRDVVKKGDLLLLRVIRIDVRRKRLGLSLKRVLESEWSEWAARLAAAEMEKQAALEEAEADAAEEATEAEEETAEEPGAEVEEVVEAEAEVSEGPADEPEAEVAQESVEAEEEPAEEPVGEPLEAESEAVDEPEAEVAEESVEVEEEPADEAEAEAVEDAVEAEEELADEPEAEEVEDAVEAEEELADEPGAEAAEESVEAEEEPADEAEAVEESVVAEDEPGEEPVVDAEEASEAEAEVTEDKAEAVEDSTVDEEEPAEDPEPAAVQS
jgi:small subunit ribosomal protein S1